MINMKKLMLYGGIEAESYKEIIGSKLSFVPIPFRFCSFLHTHFLVCSTFFFQKCTFKRSLM